MNHDGFSVLQKEFHKELQSKIQEEFPQQFQKVLNAVSSRLFAEANFELSKEFSTISKDVETQNEVISQFDNLATMCIELSKELSLFTANFKSSQFYCAVDFPIQDTLFQNTDLLQEFLSEGRSFLTNVSVKSLSFKRQTLPFCIEWKKRVCSDLFPFFQDSSLSEVCFEIVLQFAQKVQVQGLTHLVDCKFDDELILNCLKLLKLAAGESLCFSQSEKKSRPVENTCRTELVDSFEEEFSSSESNLNLHASFATFEFDLESLFDFLNSVARSRISEFSTQALQLLLKVKQMNLPQRLKNACNLKSVGPFKNRSANINEIHANSPSEKFLEIFTQTLSLELKEKPLLLFWCLGLLEVNSNTLQFSKPVLAAKVTLKEGLLF